MAHPDPKPTVQPSANTQSESILDRVHTPADMKGLSDDELQTLNNDVRQFMI